MNQDVKGSDLSVSCALLGQGRIFFGVLTGEGVKECVKRRNGIRQQLVLEFVL